MSTTGHETEAINVRGLKASLKKGGNIGIFNECICSTAGGTAAKVTNTVPPSFSLVSGAKIIVKFTYAITVANATLQVGETAAKPIRIMGAALDANIIKAGTSVLLSYDGTAYNIIGGVGGNDVDVNYDTTNKKITKTIDDVTSDVVTAATIVSDGINWTGVAGLGEYEGTAEYPDFDAETDTVHLTPQTLTEAKKTQARANIGAEVITYNSTTNMLQKTVGSTTTNICSIGQSGFMITTDETTGTDSFSAIGGAAITVNDETGTDIFTF